MQHFSYVATFLQLVHIISPAGFWYNAREIIRRRVALSGNINKVTGEQLALRQRVVDYSRNMRNESRNNKSFGIVEQSTEFNRE